jgi:deoxycytidine triphosphate deaminase
MDTTTSLLRGGWLTGAGITAAVSNGDIVISPFSAMAVNPNSYNYTLGPKILRLTSTELDMLGADEFEELQLPASGLSLEPGECYLASTAEEFGSSVYAALITGRSSIGRKFITNHVTAGLIDTGFVGKITLEVTVQRRTRVYPGIPFGQIFWFSLAGMAVPQYNGKYQNQLGPTPSRLAKERRSHNESQLSITGADAEIAHTSKVRPLV